LETQIMSRSSRFFFLCAIFLYIASPLRAQVQGCVDSPENPTVVLALVGSAGAFLSAARTRLRRRRNSSSQ
jgi:XrtJ-associated TM-motif-TM protein